jgi:AcrR family transcriptional regulator
MEPNDTRTRLLDAAERAFSAKGYDGASMREITAEAGANLAAAHYHFGSKEDLFVAVVARRMEPMNLERIRLLDAAQARAAGGAVAIEEILEALIVPVLRTADADGAGAGCFLRLFGRLQNEEGELWKRIVNGPLREVRMRVAAAMHRSLPHLPKRELMWRMHFTIGTMANIAADQHRLELISGGLCSSRDVEGTIRRLIPFLAAGLRAPLEPARPKRPAVQRARRAGSRSR